MATSMVYRKTAKEVWNKLQNMFSQGNGPRVYQLQKDLASFSQGELSVTEYFTNLSILWDELQNYEPIPTCSCEKCVCNVNEKISKIHHREAVMQFLMGLNDSFSHVRGQILLMDPIPSVEKVFSLLIQDEKQRSVGQSNNGGPFVESTALAAKGTSFDPKNNKGKGKERPTCSHCGLQGHTVEKCYKLHGYRPGYKAKGKASLVNQVSAHFDSQDSFLHAQPQTQFPFTSDQYQKILAMIGTSSQDSQNSVAMANCVSFAPHATTPLSGIDILPHDVFDSRHSIFSAKVINRTAFENHVWVIDTGASNHIVCSVSMLTTFTSISHCVVKLPNNESATITHVGTVQLSAQFTLHNVLCVPSFTFNLLSVSQLTKQLPFCLVFLSQFCLIQDLTCWRTIGVGEMHHGLYLLQRKLSSSSSKHPSLSQCLSHIKSIPIANSVVDMSKLWLSRLGHPSFNKMSAIKDVLPSFSQPCDDICTVCPLAKQKRLPFPTHNEISKFPFDLIHIDV